MLMAYADGALDPTTREFVEAALARHPEYRDKVAKFRATLTPLRELFHQELGAADYGPLIERIRKARVAPPAAAVRRLPQRVPAGLRSLRPYLPMAMAASVALIVGAALGWVLHPAAISGGPSQPSFIALNDGNLLARGALYDLLERTGSNSPVTVSADDGKAWELEASYTFRSRSERPCRRYEVRNGDAGRFAGYACRDDSGQWLVRGYAQLGAPPSKGQSFAPAQAPAATDADAALEASIRAAGGDNVYQGPQETAAIASGWAR
jgi:hypothetical protein